MPTSYSSQSSPQYFERDVVTERSHGPHPLGVKNDQFTGKKRSIGRRIFGTLTRLTIAVLIGVGATWAWQYHGDEAKEMVRTWAPSLAWLLPTSTSTEGQESTAATSAEMVQQIKPLTLDLAIVRHSLEQLATKIEQLAAKQDQMAQNIATLQLVEQEISKKLSSRAAAPRKPPQPAAQSLATQSSPVPLAPPPTDEAAPGGTDAASTPH